MPSPSNYRDMNTLGLFQGYGIEIEYMIVDRETLAVAPLTDRLLEAVAGHPVNEIERTETAWSNELALHVVELKTNGPAPQLSGLAALFQRDISAINTLLEPFAARLMPAAMHPWMNPGRETRLWPYEQDEIYQAFDRIFDCRGHGWSNLQSMHINLPFANDGEFARLHAAIRLLLPLLPALAASSPIADGRVQASLDYRLAVYAGNAARIPSVTGQVIPEPVFSRHDYEHYLLGNIYRDLAPFDPAGILQHEWVNARGAIARFDRNAIEIRVLDTQECPRADLAVAAAVVTVAEALVNEAWSDLARQQTWEVSRLHAIYADAVVSGEQAVINDPAYAALFGFPERGRCRLAEIWQYLIETLLPTAAEPGWDEVWETIIDEGPLARRILKATGDTPTADELQRTYTSLCQCLARDQLFHG